MRHVLLLLLFALWTPLAQSALSDEIQVYADDLNAPGEAGLEVHVITYPKGRHTPEYAGEVTPQHSLFVTPELSWGLTRSIDVGLYIPTARDGATGHLYWAGLKGRIKWLPIRGEDHDGWFAGINLEIGRVGRRFSQVRSNGELRFILGWHDDDWLLAANPTVGWEMSDNPAGRPDFSLGLKGTRRVAQGIALGMEYYTERGPIGQPLPWQAQENKIFLVMDYDRKPWNLNVGIGHGLTRAADKLILKTIFEFSF